MKANSNDWYKKGWSLDIKQQSWTENTAQQVDFIIKSLSLRGDEKILDLACGYGRHSLEFARRGYAVTGVDITEVYIADAKKNAEAEKLNATFLCADIRELTFCEEFDVVLNLGDGAIGYLENDTENLKIFDVIAKALKPGGKSYMDIQSGDYADAHFPQQLWDAGEHGLTLSLFEWDPETRIMLYGQNDFAYGEKLEKPQMPYGNPTRLYTQKEISEIMATRGMKLFAAYCDEQGNPASEKGFQLLACSCKENQDAPTANKDCKENQDVLAADKDYKEKRYTHLSHKFQLKKLGLEDIDEIRPLCESNPMYYEHCGIPCDDNTLREDILEVAPGKTLEDKDFLGYYREGKLVAIMDLMWGYPDPDIAYIGLFMVDRHVSGKGIGTEIIEEICGTLPNIGFAKVRLAYVKKNPQSTHFWIKNGFIPFKEVDDKQYGLLKVAERNL